MDAVARVLAAFGARGKRNQSFWKLDVLLELTGVNDARVVKFLREVLTDDAEPVDVRIDALRRLRLAALAPGERVAVAEAGLRVLSGRADADGDLRPEVALMLGDFTDVPGVVVALGARASDTDEPLDLRYNAFTSLQRAGPTPESLALLDALGTDETLGRSARAVLTVWGTT